MNAVNHESKKGAVLLLVLLVVLFISTLGLGLMKLADLDAIETSAVQNKTRAFWLAEGGLHEVRAMARVWNNRTPLVNLNMVGSAVLSGTVDGIGTYQVDVRDYTGEGWNNAGGIIKRYMVVSTGRTLSGITQTVAMHARLNTFGNYVYATHTEGTIRFTTGDNLFGEMYSNDEFTINGKPVFHGDVHTAHETVDYTDSRDPGSVDPDVFTQGLELGAPQLNFGQFGDDPIEELQAGAALLLTGNYSIEFLGGQYRYRTHATTDLWATNFIAPMDIIYVTGNAYVEGRVGGAVSVASEEAIHITGDLVYASTPNNNYALWPDNYSPSSHELIGLLSKEAVQVDSQGYGNDINIHAAVYIIEADDNVETGNPGFGTQDRYTGIGSPKINLLGGISQYKRGVVGTTGGSGFLKNYTFDERFRDTPPPGIPYSAYSFSNWRHL